MASGVTVADALRLALPSGTRVAFGGHLLRRPISWVRALATRPYALGNIERGTLVLLSLRGLTARPEIQRLPRLVEALIAADIAALVLTDDAPGVDAAAAVADVIPVLVLPPESPVPAIERAVVGLIVDRESQVERRTAEVYQHLIQLALADVPIQAMADTLAQAAGRVVYVEDEYGTLQAVGGPSDPDDRSLPSTEQATAMYSARQVLGFSGEAPWAFGSPLIKRLLAGSAYEVYSAPVSLGGAGAGFLTLLGKADEMEDLDEQLAAKGASAFAIPIAKQRAIIETQTRLQGSFLESLFTGGALNEEEIAARARYLGHNLYESYETACIALDATHNGLGTAKEAERATLWASFLDGARREVLGQWPKALVKDRGELLALLVPNVPETSFERESIEVMRTRLRQLAGGATVTVGTGHSATGPREIVRSYLQAEQAARIGRRFLGGDQTVSFAELGAYRLLASIEDRDALVAFCQEYLGPLEAYDARSNAELVATLEGFFRANGNHARAAEALHLHRNTLLYRLGRVEALSGRDLDDPETRLCLQLALKIRHLTLPTPNSLATGKEFP